MSSALFRISAISLLITFFVSTLAAQQPSPATERQLKDQREQLQAIAMIKQSAGDAPLWDNKKAAVRVLADAADLLWDETPGQGPKWLTKAWELTGKVSGVPRDPNLKDFFTGSDQSVLRVTVLAVARRHDPTLAEKFLRQLSQSEQNGKKERGAFDDRTIRSEQLLQMAQQTIESNPEAALNLAQQSLADGISYTLQNVLTALRKKNVDLANRLFDLALARFRGSQPDPSEAQVLAGYLFQSGFTFSTNPSGQTILAVNPVQRNLSAVASSEPVRARSFLMAVYEVLLTRLPTIDSAEGQLRAQQTLLLANRLIGPYRTFAEQLVPSVQGFLTQLQRQLAIETNLNETSTTTTTGNTTRHSASEARYEERLSEMEEAAARQSNPIARKLAYVEAALATKPVDYQRGKSIAEKIDDDNLRPEVVSFVLYRGALALLQEGQTEKALELAPQISDGLRRAVVRTAIAQRLSANAPDEQRAFSLLNDVARDLEKEEGSIKSAKIALGRVAVVAKLDREQGLMALEQMIETINRLDNFDLHDESAPNLGLAVSSVSSATIPAPRISFSFRQAIEPLVSDHFEEVAAAAERLSARELRAMARLDAAKSYLQIARSIKQAASPAIH
jgi:hypothetical protein